MLLCRERRSARIQLCFADLPEKRRFYYAYGQCGSGFPLTPGLEPIGVMDEVAVLCRESVLSEAGRAPEACAA